MSGHNKWSKIKHKKAITDAKKSKEFSKLVRLIKVEAAKASGDPTAPGLRMVIEKAKAANMPKDNIERAIKSATGSDAQMNEVTYEAYGPGGTALIIEGLTDNNNRTNAEIKHLLSQHGLQLAAPGSASWAFEKKESNWEAKTTTPIQDADAEKLGNIVDALEDHDDVQAVYTNAE